MVINIEILSFKQTDNHLSTYIYRWYIIPYICVINDNVICKSNPNDKHIVYLIIELILYRLTITQLAMASDCTSIVDYLIVLTLLIMPSDCTSIVMI